MADKISAFPVLSTIDTGDRLPVVDNDTVATRSIDTDALIADWLAYAIPGLDDLYVASPNYHVTSLIPDIGTFLTVAGLSGAAFDELVLPGGFPVNIEAKNGGSHVWSGSIMTTKLLLIVHEKNNTVNVNTAAPATFADGTTSKPLTKYDILFLLFDVSGPTYHPVFYTYTP